MKTFLLTLILLPIAASAQEFDLLDYIQRNQAKLQDTSLARLALDSLSHDSEGEYSSGVQWYNWSVQASADGRFKVFHFEGESCGAYCNPYFMSVLSIYNPHDQSHACYETDEFFFELDSIIALEEGTYYLVFGHHFGRPRGIEGAWGQTVILCSLEDGFKIKWQFQATTSNLVDRDEATAEISFNAQDLTLSYVYDWYEEEEDFRAFRASGIWKFNGADFEEQEKTKVYYD